MPTYEEYVASGGRLSSEDFSLFAPRAWAYLDTLTFGRAALALLESVAGKVKSAFVALTDEFYRQAQGGEIASVSNDGYSETYVASGKTPEQRLYALAALYLATTGLLYRGVCRYAGL